jgi:hypothetical protein
MQAGHSVLVTGFTARLPGESQGQARMTLPAATAPDAEGRTPARGTQL